MSKANRTYGNFLGLITLIFVLLKLTNQVQWGWFWVLSPILIPLILVGFLFVLLSLVAFIFAVKDALKRG